jgi:hypothetical protein
LPSDYRFFFPSLFPLQFHLAYQSCPTAPFLPSYEQHNFLAQKLITSSEKHKLNILFLNQVQNAYTTRTVTSLVKACDLRFLYFVYMHSILPYWLIF